MCASRMIDKCMSPTVEQIQFGADSHSLARTRGFCCTKKATTYELMKLRSCARGGYEEMRSSSCMFL